MPSCPMSNDNLDKDKEGALKWTPEKFGFNPEDTPLELAHFFSMREKLAYLLGQSIYDQEEVDQSKGISELLGVVREKLSFVREKLSESEASMEFSRLVFIRKRLLFCLERGVKMDFSEFRMLKKLAGIDEEPTPHLEAYRIIREANVSSLKRYEDIHSDKNKRKAFSEHDPGKVNDFAHWFLEHSGVDDGDSLLSIGCGFANDELFLAKAKDLSVTAVDSSSTAIDSAKANIRNESSKDRAFRDIISPDIRFYKGDYIQMLEGMLNYETMRPHYIYSHSSLHYAPSEIFEYEWLPAMAEVLKNGVQKDDYGKLCLAIKTAQSDSATNSDQDVLTRSPYLHAIHFKDRLFRFYPENKDVLLKALDRYFSVDKVEEREIVGYDKEGDTEHFVYVIASPE